MYQGPSQPTATLATQPVAHGEWRRRIAIARLVTMTALLAAVVAGATYAERPDWWWLPYNAVYLLAAFAASAAARSAHTNSSGSEEERMRRSRGWVAMTVYALVVPAATLLGFLPGQDPTTVVGLLNDIVAFAAYPAAVIAILSFTRPRADIPNSTRILDLSIVVAATLSFAGYMYLRRTSEGLLTADGPHFVYFVLIPIGALAVLLAATWLVLDLRGRSMDGALALVLGAIATSTVADLTAWVPGFEIAALNPGLWATAMWILAAGATLEVASPASLDREADSGEAVGYSFIPALAASVVIIAMLNEARRSQDYAGRYLVYGLVAVMLLVIARLFSIVYENRRLLVRQREADARFRSLVRRSSDALLVVRPDDRIGYHSPALASVFGLQVSDGLGLPILDLVARDDVPAVGRLLRAARHEGETRSAVLVRSAGSGIRWVELVAANHADDPDIGGIVIAARDVTERRLLENRLAQAEKLESVGRLAGGVAHDFNNMLTAILGNADLVEQSAARGQVDLDDIREIQRAARRSAELTQQLLAFARRQMVEPREILADTVVESMDRMLRRLLGPSITLQLEPQSTPWQVVADPSQLEQIVLNLALNARDAMPDGGELSVSLTRTTVQPGAHPVGSTGDLESMPDGEYVHLRVRDTGHGIAAEHLDRLFEPFFTTKAEGMGTGLGLATVYGITKQAGGFLGVDSLPGRGTVFDIYFPRAEPGAQVTTGVDEIPHTPRATDRQ